MNDRDLIAIVLHKREFGGQSNSGDSCNTCLESADAVLSALGDRLLPELPDWCEFGDVSLDNEGYYVTLWGRLKPHPGLGGIPVREQLDGTGPTIPDAIRNALEDKE